MIDRECLNETQKLEIETTIQMKQNIPKQFNSLEISKINPNTIIDIKNNLNNQTTDQINLHSKNLSLREISVSVMSLLFFCFCFVCEYAYKNKNLKTKNLF